MLLPLLLSQLIAAPPAKLDLVPEAQRAQLVTAVEAQGLIGTLEVLEAGTTDGGVSVLVREVVGEGDSCRERLYKASVDGAGPMSWTQLGADCCSLGLLRCDRSDADWMYHTHRVLSASDNAAVKALVGPGVKVQHAAVIDGKLTNATKTLTAKALSADANKADAPRNLIAFGYLNMTISCAEQEPGAHFQCNADAGGIHMRFFFERQRDKKRPKAPWSTLEGRLVRVEVDED